jgi:diguanylate cyclase (GGDEF)-like protein
MFAIALFILGAVIFVALLATGLTFFLVAKNYQQTLTRMKSRIEQLEGQLSTDDTTGLCSARTFPDLLRQAVHVAERTGQPLCIILLDIDSFGRINRDFSYEDGDRVLRSVADTVTASIETADYRVCRYRQGDEFLIIAPYIDGRRATIYADRLRRSIERQEFTVSEADQSVSFSISAGTTQWLGKPDSPEKMLGRAEEALKQAKLTRNAVVAV